MKELDIADDSEIVPAAVPATETSAEAATTEESAVPAVEKKEESVGLLAQS